MAKKGYITISSEYCKGCEFCIEYCPKDSIYITEEINSKGYYYAAYKEEKSECTGCTICAVMCPEAAIEVYRE